ncbi:MAG: hypothetical protein AAGE52_03090 [Myxococcota bacterium]
MPLWQELVPEGGASVLRDFVDVPNVDVSNGRRSRRLYLARVDGEVVAALENDSGQVTRLGNPALRPAPWVIDRLRQKRKAGAVLRASSAEVARWVRNATELWSEQRRYLLRDVHPRWRDAVATIELPEVPTGDLEANLRVTSRGLELHVAFGAACEATAGRAHALPRGTALASPSAGAGFDEVPYAWGDVDLWLDAAGWSAGEAPAPTVSAWSADLRYGEWIFVSPGRVRQLLDHAMGQPVQAAPWWRAGARPTVFDYQRCEGGFVGTVRVESAAALANLYIAASRHLR